MGNLLIIVTSIGLLLMGISAIYMIWYLWGRDPDIPAIPKYLSEPPSDLPPGLVGVLVDERADMRDTTATLLDLARREYLYLAEHISSKGRQYSLRSPAAVTDIKSLSDFEQAAYRATMGESENELVFDGALPPRFFNALPFIEQAMYRALVTRGFFRRSPFEVRGKQFLIAIIASVIVFFGGVMLFGSAFALSYSSIPCLLGGPVVFALGLFALAPFMPAKTRKGAEEAARWRAFHHYLQNLKKYTDVQAAIDQFERYLPYAVAFGMERAWIKTFAQIKDVPVPMPRWYRVIDQRDTAGVAFATRGDVPLEARSPAPAVGKPTGGTPESVGLAEGLSNMGEGLVGGLNEMGSGLIAALNAAGESLSNPPSASDFKGGTIQRGSAAKGNSGNSFWGSSSSKGLSSGRSYRQSYRSKGSYRNSSHSKGSSWGRSSSRSSFRSSSSRSSFRSSSRRSSSRGKGR